MNYFPEVSLSPKLELYADQGVHIMGHGYGLHLILYRPGNSSLKCRYMEWGCIPFYVRDEKAFLKQRPNMLNARSERILEGALVCQV